MGVRAYTKVIDGQSPEVQQRVRDFLYYGDWKKHRDKALEFYERVYPGLYPKTYKFGHDDPVFAKEIQSGSRR
jgi:hypothetical protein